MKTTTIFKRKVNQGLLFMSAVILTVAGCKKGTFDINTPGANSPAAVPASFALPAALQETGGLMYNSSTGGRTGDVFENWMGYWMQSGGFTPSPEYATYTLTSSSFTGNFDAAYLDLANYKSILSTTSTDPSQSYYKAIAMIMTSFVYQRVVDCYNNVPYSQAGIINAQFSYKYDDAATIYKSITAKLDSAVLIINNNPTAVNPAKNDVMFGGNMSNWKLFAKTLKLKILMRQSEMASSPTAAGLSGMTAADFLGAGVDGAVNPGYSNAADAQLAPLYYDCVANAAGSGGLNSTYWVANSYGVNFFKNHGDTLRLKAVYKPKADGSVLGRAYGSNAGNETNSTIALIQGTGYLADGKTYKGATQSTYLIPAFESLFLVAEAQERGYIPGDYKATFNTAVAESFRLLGVTGAAAYTAQNDALTNINVTSDPLNTIIVQKWAALNSIDPLESWSDWRRLGIPRDLPNSIFPGNTAPHIPFALPYPVNEVSFNAANVPSGGTASDIFTKKIFWMK